MGGSCGLEREASHGAPAQVGAGSCAGGPWQPPARKGPVPLNLCETLCDLLGVPVVSHTRCSTASAGRLGRAASHTWCLCQHVALGALSGLIQLVEGQCGGAGRRHTHGHPDITSPRVPWRRDRHLATPGCSGPGSVELHVSEEKSQRAWFMSFQLPVFSLLGKSE